MGQDEPGGQKQITSNVLSDLEVCDLEDTEYIQLPKVFTHSNIPVQKENIPSQEQLQKWPYLSEVILPHIDADVGLLLGANNPKAMEPWHIINSQDDGPYAVKTVLGWMVSGPIKNENIISKDKTAHYSVNRISVVEIEQLLVQQYNTDFPERHYDDKEEMSQEDKQFMLSVEKTTKFVDGHYCIGLPLRNEEAKLPNNRCVAEQRAASLRRNLQNDPEVKNITVNTITAEEKSDPVNKLLQYYSSWDRLKRAVAWILRAKETLTDLKNKRKELQLSISRSEKDTKRQNVLVQQHIEKYKSAMEKKPLTLEQLMAAETEIIRHSQAQWFPDEVKALHSNVSVKRSSQLYKLDPILQDGILRVGGWLDRSVMPEDAKHPSILSKHSRVATLILTDVHEKIGHCGRNYMLSQLRQKIWIPQATSAIRKLISECTVCRRLRGQVGEQKMANLPEDRLLPDKPPFTNVGVDFFGPFDVKRGRSTVKRYGVMFTCLTIRAVHIKVAHSLDTSSCINALRRFISRRGQITIMRSDNGTNFVGAEKELREAIENLNQSQIEKAMQKKGIKWIFNSPAASHQGGVWERQIRTVRRILNALVKEQTLTDDSLQTLLCEVEIIQTIPDSSGTVRRVKLQTKTSTLERPINKLCLLQEAM